MPTLRLVISAAAVLAALTLGAAAAPEPEGLWTGPMVSDTPATLQGAQVVDLAGLERLLPQRPLLIDSGPANHKPEGLPTGTPWNPTHRSIPGASWFPGAGRGDLDPVKAAAFLARVNELTGGDRTRPIVTFCQPHCWGSWNVGKRLVAAGYSAVYWFPGGIDAWQAEKETAAVGPQPGW